MSNLDRLIRVIVAAVFAYLYFGGIVTGVLGIILVVLAVVLLLTSIIFFAHCMLFSKSKPIIKG
jgi:phage-related minor tail protein